MPITIGNDVVDLSMAPQKHLDRRFLNRVFSAQEQECIEQHLNPHWMLWALWAAKEAAFKAYQKQHLTARFSPQKIEVSSNASSQYMAYLANDHIHCFFEEFKQSDYSAIHCLAIYGEPGGLMKNKAHTVIRHQPDCKEYVRQSQAVRQLAYDFCQEKGLGPVEIKRPMLNMGSYEKRGPPYLYQKGTRMSHDISLSHDGAFLAVGII